VANYKSFKKHLYYAVSDSIQKRQGNFQVFCAQYVRRAKMAITKKN